jgi:hypothetical protein
MWPVRKADNLPPSCADVKKSDGRNLLDPVQAGNGTALLAMLYMFQAVSPPIIRSSKLYTHNRLVYVELACCYPMLCVQF